MKTAIVLLLTALSISALAESLTFWGETDRHPISYRTGETIVFTAKLVDRAAKGSMVKGRRLVWTRDGDDGKVEKGEAISDSPLVVRTKIDIPGFVRLTVNVLDENGKIVPGPLSVYVASAGADVGKIRTTPLPKGFNAFWDKTIADLAAEPMRSTLDEAESGDPDVKLRRFSVNLLPGEGPTTGLLAWPKAAAPRSLPIEVIVPGYGYGRSSISPRQVKAGSGRIVLLVTRYGEDPLGSEAYHQNIGTNLAWGFCFRNNSTTNANDMYKMAVRDVRALAFAKTLPQWDGKTIFVGGGSMGGYRAVALAALDRDVTRCEANYSWLCDYAGKAKFGRIGGWLPEWTPELDFVDAVHFATRVTCPVRMQFGLADYICPPSGPMALFNAIASPDKHLRVQQNVGHGFYPSANCPAYDWPAQ